MVLCVRGVHAFLSRAISGHFLYIVGGKTNDQFLVHQQIVSTLTVSGGEFGFQTHTHTHTHAQRTKREATNIVQNFMRWIDTVMQLLHPGFHDVSGLGRRSSSRPQTIRTGIVWNE